MADDKSTPSERMRASLARQMTSFDASLRIGATFVMTKRIREAMSNLETTQTKIEAQAHSLHDAAGEGSPPEWVHMFSTSVWELNEAGNQLLEAINGQK